MTLIGQHRNRPFGLQQLLIFLLFLFPSPSLQHHATTATSPATSLATARNLEPRPATIAARMGTSLVNAMLLIAVEAVVVAAAAEVVVDLMAVANEAVMQVLP